MPKLPQRPAYVPGSIDQEIIEKACRWNVNPSKASERVGFIGLEAGDNSDGAGFLRNFTYALNVRGFRAIYLDAGIKYPDQVPSALAAALHGAIAGNLLRVVRNKIQEFWNCAWHVKLFQVLVLASLPALWLYLNFVKSPWYRPPYVSHFFLDFLLQDIAYQLLNLFGITFLIQVALAWPKSGTLPFTKAAQERFKDVDGYLRVLGRMGGRVPVALLVENASKLSIWPEVEVFNTLLALDSSPSDDRRLPPDFRVLIMMLNPPMGLELSGKTDSFIPIPEPSPAAGQKTQKFRDEVDHRVNAFVSDSLHARKPGVIGSLEWMVFEAELGRPVGKEREELYLQVVRSGVLPLLGLTEKPPKKCPKAIFASIPAKDRDVLYPFYAASTSVFYEKFYREVKARARLMLMVPGLACVRRKDHWRDWDLTTRNALLAAADHAENLSFSDQRGTRVSDVIHGSPDERGRLLAELVLVLVTGSEIQKAMGHLGRASEFLQAATRWYVEALPALDEAIQDRLFYGLWDCFWLSCDKDQRDWILKFELEHPQVREINAWKVLKNYERRKQGAVLLQDVVDPGPGRPELGNVYQLTQRLERLIVEWAYDFNAAAADAQFDLGVVYHEQYPTFIGYYLASIRIELICKRQNDPAEQMKFVDTLKEQWDHIEPVWYGDRLLRSTELFLESIFVHWSTKTPDLEGAIKERNESIAHLLNIRKVASVMGIGELIRYSSFELGFFNTLSLDKQLSGDALKPWPEAERYFQEVLDIERKLGWALRSVIIFGLRCRLGAANEDSIVDDQVAWYYAAKKARYPLDRLNELLSEALSVSANHASTEAHKRHCARLHEEAARMIREGVRGPSYWVKADLKEEVAYVLFFAAWRRLQIGDVAAADRIAEEMETVIGQAEATRPESDGVREARLGQWSLKMEIARKNEDQAQYRSLLARCWGAMRARDAHAYYIFESVLSDDQHRGLLTVPCSLDFARDFNGNRLGEDFTPTQEAIPGDPPSLALFEWRLLQIAHASEALKKSNNAGFFVTVLSFGSLSRSVDCTDRCRELLIKLLLEAEEFFARESPSNSQQRQCLEYLERLDPARTAEIQQRLKAIEDEDIILKQREQAILEAIRTSGNDTAMRDLDNEFFVAALGKNGHRYADACQALLTLAQSMFDRRDYAGVITLLERHARQRKSSRASWARLRLTHLWRLAMEYVADRLNSIPEADDTLSSQIDQLLSALLPEAVKDRLLLEEYRTELRRRLDEAHDQRPTLGNAS